MLSCAILTACRHVCKSNTIVTQTLSLHDEEVGVHAGLTHLDFCSRNNRRDEDVTNVGAEGLAGMTALRTLSLAGHRALSSAGLGFLAACSALTSLDLSGEHPQELTQRSCAIRQPLLKLRGR